MAAVGPPVHIYVNAYHVIVEDSVENSVEEQQTIRNSELNLTCINSESVSGRVCCAAQKLGILVTLIDSVVCVAAPVAFPFSRIVESLSCSSETRKTTFPTRIIIL